jgi:hypothetical protein
VVVAKATREVVALSGDLGWNTGRGSPPVQVFAGLLVEYQRDELKRLGSGVFQGMPFTALREGDISSGHFTDSPIVIELSMATVDVIGFHLIGMDVVSKATTGLECGMAKHPAFVIQFLIPVEQVPYGYLSFALKRGRFLFHTAIIHFSYHRVD